MQVSASEAAAVAPRSVVVEVADLKVTDDPNGVLITYALGSCIAVCVHDPVLHLAGMIHYMLPVSKVSPEKAKIKPAMFADTGVPLLFRELYALGANKKNLVVKAVGGGSLYDDKGLFNIGKRNHTVLRKLLWKNNILIAAEDTGGRKSRTTRFFAQDGRVIVSSGGEETLL
jgi:chemotaxis protein CheD